MHAEMLREGRLAHRLRYSAMVLLVVGVSALVASTVIPGGSIATRVRPASAGERQQLLKSADAHRNSERAIVVLANDPHRAAVCIGRGRALFFQQEQGRWRVDHDTRPPALARALTRVCH